MKQMDRLKWNKIIQHWTGLLLSVLLIVVLVPFNRRVLAATDIGYKDFSFSGASAPTGQRPQSKLWFNDGTWWGSLYNAARRRFDIYRFDWATDTWSNTGTIIDSRSKSSADMLWDGTKLYAISAIPPGTNGDASIRLMRYSYNSATKTYSLDTGFPVTIISRTVELVVLDKDTQGKLWITYTFNNNSSSRSVYVSHTTTNDLTWVTPYVLPLTGANNLSSDDISAIISFNGNIGVMWSNQNTSSVYFGIHRDGDPDSAWTANPAIQEPNYADDHLNLKALSADASGQVYAVVKTSLNDVSSNSNQPLILLLRLDNQGSWTRRTVWRVPDNFTRPIVLLDTQNRTIYVFGTQEFPNQTSGAVYYKQLPLDDPGAQFPTGLGTPFIVFSTDTHINNASSTKQNLNSSTGLLVIAGDDTSDYYFHNKLSLGSAQPTPTNTPQPTATNTPTATQIPTSTPTSTPTAIHTDTPTSTPTIEPTSTPTETSVSAPTDTPTTIPGDTPTSTPTDIPTLATDTPTSAPTDTPTLPVDTPTSTPTDIPTLATDTPTSVPTDTPTLPVDTPTSTPTDTPLPVPTATDTPLPTPTNTPLPTDTPTPTPGSPGPLFSDGFESGDFSAWSLVKTGGDGAALVQTGTVKTGSFAAQLSETANTGSLAYIRASLSPTQTNFTVSLDIMITQEGASGGNVPVLRLFDVSGARVVSLYRQNLSGNRIWINHGSSTSTTGLLPLGTWGHFDVHVIAAGTSASTIEVYQNGNLIYQTTTASLSTSGILSIQIGNETARQTFKLFADDVQISQ